MTKTKSQKKRANTARVKVVNSARNVRPKTIIRTVERVSRPSGSSSRGPSTMGEKIGMHLGGAAQKILKMVTGFGDYKVEGNSIMGQDVPIMRNSQANSGFIVRHREYIGDIYGSQTFVNNQFLINPGLSSTFPWLATIASSYEEYRFRGLIFEFKSMSADNVLSTTTASTALGTVVMATQYNMLTPAFSDKRTMENYEFANSAKPSVTFIHPIECKNSMDAPTHRYIRTPGTVLSGDQRLYDLGLFQLVVQGEAFTGGVVGELWATYEVELYKPKIYPSLICMSDWFFATVGVDSTAWFGTTRVVRRQTLFGSFSSNSQYNFPLGTVGRFLVVVAGTCNAALFNAPGITGVNGVTIPAVIGNPPGVVNANIAPGNGVLTSARFSIQFCLQVQPTGTGAASGFTITGGNMTGPGSADIIISCMDFTSAISY